MHYTDKIRARHDAAVGVARDVHLLVHRVDELQPDGVGAAVGEGLVVHERGVGARLREL